MRFQQRSQGLQKCFPARTLKRFSTMDISYYQKPFVEVFLLVLLYSQSEGGPQCVYTDDVADVCFCKANQGKKCLTNTKWIAECEREANTKMKECPRNKPYCFYAHSVHTLDRELNNDNEAVAIFAKGCSDGKHNSLKTFGFPAGTLVDIKYGDYIRFDQGHRCTKYADYTQEIRKTSSATLKRWWFEFLMDRDVRSIGVTKSFLTREIFCLCKYDECNVDFKKLNLITTTEKPSAVAPAPVTPAGGTGNGSGSAPGSAPGSVPGGAVGGSADPGSGSVPSPAPAPAPVALTTTAKTTTRRYYSEDATFVNPLTDIPVEDGTFNTDPNWHAGESTLGLDVEKIANGSGRACDPNQPDEADCGPDAQKKSGSAHRKPLISGVCYVLLYCAVKMALLRR